MSRKSSEESSDPYSSKRSGEASKKSKNQSKKSILRKAGSESKNKNKHAKFDESQNIFEYYKEAQNNNDIEIKNDLKRQSLNTVSEEAEQNSKSTSKQLSPNIISFRNSINNNNIYTNDNSNIYNQGNIVNNDNNNNNSNLNISLNIQSKNYHETSSNNINNYEKEDKDKDIQRNKDNNNKFIKKPKSRKTLESVYDLDNDIINKNQNLKSGIDNINQELFGEKKEEKIETNNNKDNFSEFHVELTEDGDKKEQNNIEKGQKTEGNLPDIKTTIIKEKEEYFCGSSNGDSTIEKIQEETRKNTEINKILFMNLKNDSNILSNSQNLINSENYGTNFSLPENIGQNIIQKNTNTYTNININTNNNNTNNNTNNNNTNTNTNTNNYTNTNMNMNTNTNTNINTNTKTNINANTNTNNNIINSREENNIENNNLIKKNILRPNFNRRITIGIIDEEQYNYDKNQVNNDLSKPLNSLLQKPKINNNRITMGIVDDEEEDLFINYKNENEMPPPETKKPLVNNNRNTMGIIDDDNENDFFNNNKNKNDLPLKEIKKPDIRNRRITMGINMNDNDSFDMEKTINYQNFNNSLEQNDTIEIDSFIDETAYVEPKIYPQKYNVDYNEYKKYLKNRLIKLPLSERKDYFYKNLLIKNFKDSPKTVKKIPKLNMAIMENLIKIDTGNRHSPNSSVFQELISDSDNKIKNGIDNNENLLNISNESINKQSIEEEIITQVNILEKDLMNKQKLWEEKIKGNAERHQKYELLLNKEEDEINNLKQKINEVKMQNQLIKEKDKNKENYKYNYLIANDMEIKDITPIKYENINSLLFTIFIKGYSVYKFIISDNIWLDNNFSGETNITFMGIVYSEIFKNYLSEEIMELKDKDNNLTLPQLYQETLCKIFPNKYESINIHNLANIYFLSTQVSVCFLQIVYMINTIYIIDEDMTFETKDLKKYTVKFNFNTIYNSVIRFQYILDVENPFTGNILESVDIEKGDYILDNFDEYKEYKLKIIWKYFNPNKQVLISHKYFDSIFAVLTYMDNIDVKRVQMDENFVYNIMTGQLDPIEEEDILEENIEYNSPFLDEQLENIYGKRLLSYLRGDIDNNKENYFESEVKLNLPKSVDGDSCKEVTLKDNQASLYLSPKQ